MKTLRLLLLGLAVFGLCSTALAAEFEEDFESYAPGTQLHGVDNWEGWDNSAGAGALVSDAFAYSGSNSVEIGGATDLVRTFDVTGGQWVFRAMVYVPLGTTGDNFFIMLNQYTSGGDPKNWSVQMPFHLGAGTFVSENLGSGTTDIIYDQWVELRIMIDLDNNTVDEFYNDELVSSHVWQETGTDTIQAIDLYSASASAIYYDDIVLQTLAEYQTAATDPNPADAASDVAREVELSWTPGGLAVSHDVYFGDDYNAVAGATRTDPMGVLVSQGQSASTYAVDGLLEFGQDYYWRIDEVQEDGTIDAGNVWTFQAEPFSYTIENVVATSNGALLEGQGPENTVNGSGLDENGQHSADTADMWLADFGDEPLYIQFEFPRIYKMYEMTVWNHNFIFEMALGFGAKDVTVEYSTEGEEWTTLEETVFAQATSQATYTANTVLDMGGVAAKFVRLTLNTNYGGGTQVGLSEVRFSYTPSHARYPEPTDAATDVDVTTALSWRSGRDAVSHDVYLGTDPDALESVATTTDDIYNPTGLSMATTYYWQVNEVNEADAISVWEGDLWSFSTQEYIVIDDFESYIDDETAGDVVWEIWIDGLVEFGGDAANGGSQVGHATSPFAEQTIVRTGSQSMPLYFDNPSASAISEADRTLSPAQDWTTNGIQTLALSFYGAVGNTGSLYVKINNTKIPYDGPATDIGLTGWLTWNIVLADTGANLSNVSSLSVGVEGAGSGVVYIDDIRLYGKTFDSAGVEIAISTQANWWSQDAADREIQEIVDNVQGASVETFNVNEQDALAAWVEDHTANGVADLLILCGQLPDTIYAPGNSQADNSLAEMFLDNGNTIINTGDWIFYVVNGAGTNAAAGLQTIMDIPGVTVAGGDDTPVTVTAEGQSLTPSLQDFATDRPFHLDTLEGDWSAELILAQTADGLLADPVIVRNSATGGRIGVFHQAASEDDLPRGEVMSEWINNWYLDAAGGN